MLPLHAWVIAVCFLFGFAAMQPAKAQFVGDCQQDIETYCAQVEPGDGRVLACLYAHDDKISDRCFTASEELMAQIDLALARISYVVQHCASDIQTLCAGTDIGEGRILGCLLDQRDQLSSECKPIVEQVETNIAR